MSRWTIFSNEAKEFLLTILPYLVDKKQHAEITLALPIYSRNKSIERERDMQEAAYYAIASLQRKGKKVGVTV